jgi:hypothetical protein
MVVVLLTDTSTVVQVVSMELEEEEPVQGFHQQEKALLEVTAEQAVVVEI